MKLKFIIGLIASVAFASSVFAEEGNNTSTKAPSKKEQGKKVQAKAGSSKTSLSVKRTTSSAESKTTIEAIKKEVAPTKWSAFLYQDVSHSSADANRGTGTSGLSGFANVSYKLNNGGSVYGRVYYSQDYRGEYRNMSMEMNDPAVGYKNKIGDFAGLKWGYNLRYYVSRNPNDRLFRVRPMMSGSTKLGQWSFTYGLDSNVYGFKSGDVDTSRTQAGLTQYGAFSRKIFKDFSFTQYIGTSHSANQVAGNTAHRHNNYLLWTDLGWSVSKSFNMNFTYYFDGPRVDDLLNSSANQTPYKDTGTYLLSAVLSY